jgi:flagellar hook-length control protein FliK
VNAATAVAAHTAGTAAKEGDQAAPKTKTAEAITAKTAAAEAKAVDDPTAKALRDALTGGREAAASQRGEERADPHAARAETRATGQRAAGGMSPALRAAAEAVQQQLTGGSNPTTAAGAAGAGTPAAGQPQARADAGALPTQGQTFDPVLQNTGPQPGGAGQPGSLAAAGKAAPTAGTGAGNPAPTAPPAEQVAVQIQRAAAQGQSKVQIRLNPAELGRVDVKLDVGDDGHVRAVLSVDKPETLDLMQRDPRALERALQAAGLKTDQGSLSFNLREDGTGHGQNAGGDGRDRPGDRAGGMPGQPTGDAPIAAEPLGASLPADGRVDIRV